MQLTFEGFLSKENAISLNIFTLNIVVISHLSLYCQIYNDLEEAFRFKIIPCQFACPLLLFDCMCMKILKYAYITSLL